MPQTRFVTRKALELNKKVGAQAVAGWLSRGLRWLCLLLPAAQQTDARDGRPVQVVVRRNEHVHGNCTTLQQPPSLTPTLHA